MQYLEDFAPGQTIDLGSRQLSRDEILAFARQFDPQPFHVDEVAARESIYGEIIASGWHTVATLMRLMVDGYLSKVASMGSPGVDQIRWLKPVRPGDTLTARGVVQAVKRSASKPDRGVVDVEYEIFNQAGERVMTMRGMSLMKARPQS